MCTPVAKIEIMNHCTSTMSPELDSCQLAKIFEFEWNLNCAIRFKAAKEAFIIDYKNDPNATLKFILDYVLPIVRRAKNLSSDLIFIVKFLSVVLETVTVPTTEIPKILQTIHVAWALCISELKCFRKYRCHKLASKLSSRLWKLRPLFMDLLIKGYNEGKMTEKFLPIVSMACSFKETNLDKSDVLKRILEYAFSSKKGSASCYLESNSTLLNYCIDENTFKSEFMPTTHRKILRSPETAIPVAVIILKQLKLNLDTAGVEFAHPFANNLISLNADVCGASAEAILTTNMLCKDTKVISSIFDMVLQKLIGSEGRRASLEVRYVLLNTLGNLSKHNSEDVAIFTPVLKSFLDLLSSEVHEDIIESVLNQLCQWLKRPKCVLPEKAQTTIKDRLFLPTTSTKIRMALFRCIDQFIRSGGRISKPFTPLLMAMAQVAIKEVPNSPKVSEAVAAACVWLQINSQQAGKSPEGMWTVLIDIKVDGDHTKAVSRQDQLPLFLKDRFLLTASSDVTSYLVHIIHLLLSHHSTELSKAQTSCFYRTLLVIWLHTDSPSVLADIRCCLASVIYAASDRNQIGATILSCLEQLVIEAESSQRDLKENRNAGAPDMLANALIDTQRFGRRLDRLVYMLCIFAVDPKAQPCPRLFTSSSIAPVKLPLKDHPVLTVQQRLTLFIASAYPLSHTSAVQANKHSWEGLTGVLGLPVCAESIDAGIPLAEEECSVLFSDLVSKLVELPALDMTRRLTLKRLLQWSPVKFASHLSQRLCTELSSPEYLTVTSDEVGIMLTAPGMLFNQELLNSLPRYQTKTNAADDNIKPKKTAANNKKEETFLESLVSQLTAKQLDTVKVEMELEEKIRDRMVKTYARASHAMDLLTTLNQVLFELNHQAKLQFLFAEANSTALAALTPLLLTNHMLAPLALQAHDFLIRLLVQLTSDSDACRTAVQMAMWSSRIIRPVRLCLSSNPMTSPPPIVPSSIGISNVVTQSFNRDWLEFCNANTLEKQTQDILHALSNDMPATSTAVALLLSAVIPLFKIILESSPFNVEKEEEEEEVEKDADRTSWDWVTASTFYQFVQALRRQVTQMNTQETLEAADHPNLCNALPFQHIYEFTLNVVEKHSLARDAGLLFLPGEGSMASSAQKDETTLPIVCMELLHEATQLQIDHLLGSMTKKEICVRFNPTVYSLMNHLVSASHFTRASALTCMLVFGKRLPELFTHNLCPLATPRPTAAKEGDEDFPSQVLANGDPVAGKGKASTGGNVNKNEKKKRKKAALTAASSKAMGGKLDASCADPATWPPLNLAANSQLRLFVTRCDPSIDVAADGESLWLLLGLRKWCEKVGDDDGSRLQLHSQPRSNSDVLPPTALATRLLLESTRKQADIQSATALALQRCLNGKSQDEIEHLLDYWLEIYRCLKEEKPVETSGNKKKPAKTSPPKYRLQRLGLAKALGRIVSCSKSPGYSLDGKELEAVDDEGQNQGATKAGPWLQKIFRFLVDEGLQDTDENVRYTLLQAGLSATKTHGVTNLTQLLPILENFLNKAPNIAEMDNVRQSVVILLGSLAKYLDPEDPRISSIFNRLLATINFPSDVVQKAVEDCLAPLAKKLSVEALDKMFPRLLNTLLSTSGYVERRGAAYALAGIVHGCGIMALKQHGIVDKLLGALEDKQVKYRESALFAFERLSLGLGRLFEPYIVRLIPALLNSFGDASPDVREAAAVTSQAVMSKLSAHGIKLILPLLLKVLDDESSAWRSKCQAVDVLSTMTNCAPKQLSSCLPQIVPRLLTVLIDSQEGVKKAGAHALERIGTVIRNPEVQVLVPSLIASLQDPLTDKMSCLTALRDTCFTHVVDAASLALIMPVLQRAFDARSTEIRKIAAQIFGTLYSLARKEDLEPYIARILPGLRGCLLDPVPEVRSVTSRALGAMVRGVGESCSKELLPWLMATLTSESSSVDRSGAAQGLAEVLGGMGVQRLEAILPDFIKTAESTTIQPYVRDGYLMLFIYLPEVFSSEFARFIHCILSPILKALADECEYLRETALKAGQRIIDLFSDKAVELLLPELEAGLINPDWRIRHSSLQLTGDLLYTLSGSSGKGTTKTADEDDTFGTSMASRRILESLGVERRNRVLARLHIARSDPTYVVRQAASHIWKIVVENTPRTLRELMPVLVQLLLTTLGSTLRDHQQVAGRALGDLVRKLGDRVLPEVIPHLEEGLNSDDGDKHRGVCNGLIEIMRNCQPEQIASFSDRLVSPIRRSLTDISPEVRKAGARAFDLFYASIGIRALDEILPDMFAQLDRPETKAQALDGIRQLLALRGKAVMPYLVPKLTQPTLDAKTFAFLSPIAGDTLGRHLVRILPALLLAAKEVSSTDTTNEDLQHCGVIVTSVSEVTSVRLILQELITGISLTDATASSLTVPGMRQGTQPYCYAALRLLHVYIEVCCVVDDGSEESSAAPIVKAASAKQVGGRKKKNSIIVSDSGEDGSDDDDEDSDDDDSQGDDDEGDDYSDTDDDDDSDDSDDVDEERPDPKEVVRRQIPDFYAPLLRNLTKLLISTDESILVYAWACLEALLKYWNVLDMSLQVHELRQAIKSAAGEYLRGQPQIRRITVGGKGSSFAAGESTQLIPGFTKPALPLACLVRFYSECILRGHQDAKEPAAQGLAECVALSSGPALQCCVIKILGPMIRLLGERQPSSVRIAVVDSLATLIGKCPASTRPFIPQLQATFTKALSDPHRAIRLLGGRGLANIASLSPKIDSLLSDLSLAIASNLNLVVSTTPAVGPYVQALVAAGTHTDTSLQALRLCLEKSLGKARISTLRTVLSHLVPMTTLEALPTSVRREEEDGEEKEMMTPKIVRLAAAACVGVSLASVDGYLCRLRDGPKLPSDEVCQFSDLISVVPWVDKTSTSSAINSQALAMEIMVVLKVRSSTLLLEDAANSDLKKRTLQIISDCCLSNDASLRAPGYRALGYLLTAAIEVNAGEDDLASYIQLLISGFKQDTADHRVLVGNVACHVAGRLSLQKVNSASYSKWLPAFINALIGGSRDKNSNVCAACEEALVTLLHIDVPGFKDPETYAVCHNSLEVGRKTAFEEVTGRLKKQSWSQFWLKGCVDIDNTVIDA